MHAVDKFVDIYVALDDHVIKNFCVYTQLFFSTKVIHFSQSGKKQLNFFAYIRSFIFTEYFIDSNVHICYMRGKSGFNTILHLPFYCFRMICVVMLHFSKGTFAFQTHFSRGTFEYL